MNVYYGHSSVYDSISFSVTHNYNDTLESSSELTVKDIVMKRFFPDDKNIIWTNERPDNIRYKVVCHVTTQSIDVAIREKTPDGEKNNTYIVPVHTVGKT